MWLFITKTILRNKISFAISLALLTLYMGYRASKVELSYEFPRVLPKEDSTYKDYLRFKETFGEDGNVMVIGFKSDSIFNLNVFNDWYDLNNRIKKIKGVQNVISLCNLYNLKNDDSLKTFRAVPLTPVKLKSQEEADKLKEDILSLPIYRNLVYNAETNATVMAITFDRKNLNSKNRINIVNAIKHESDIFSLKHNIFIHHSGMPYIRTEFMSLVSKEMFLFLGLSIVVTSIILLIVFRSWQMVLLSMIVVIMGVVCAVGTMSLLGYKISLLSGMIPSLIIIIGIPNCIFLINRYHAEYAIHGNQARALTRMIEKVGLSLFLANITTAIGFGVFYFTNSVMLVEFGVVAAINVMLVYFLTLVFIPLVFSFLPPPTLKRTKHLTAPFIMKILSYVNHMVLNRRNLIYSILGFFTLIGIAGMNKIEIIGFVVDDLPKEHKVYKDLHFFEVNFNGVLPFEITVNTKKKNGLFAENAKALYKINRMQKIFSNRPEFSKPLSLVEGLKFSYQAYKSNNSKFYVLPPATELKKLSEYSSSLKGNKSQLKVFVDSNNQTARISYQIADIGSLKMKELIKEIKPKVDSIFDKKDYEVTFTGHSLVFLKNNDYLFDNLLESLLIEIILISIIGMILFKSIRVIILSKLPCLIPLIFTAGLMGFTGVNFKPSTILIFTIAFGIASDGTIYFLTKYRHELKNRLPIKKAITNTINETGISMIYSSLILFSGFAVFSVSSFGGTRALGILVSTTLLVSTFTNLVLLPSIFISLDNFVKRKEITQPSVMDDLDD